MSSLLSVIFISHILNNALFSPIYFL